MEESSEKPAPETHPFQAEASQVLELVVHSLYSHREVFLRELVSNASDALDRLKFRALTEPDVLGDDTTLEVRVWADADAHTVTVEDSGIGMTHDELVQNLGTIARSGTRAFLKSLKDKGTTDLALIGQFGVGFYSGYLVADRVEVTSRAAGEGTAWRWASDESSTFTIDPAERARRGTSVVLHLRDDQKEFLEEWRLGELITKYSDFVSHPILLRKAAGKDGGEPTFETVNRASALWQRPKAEITKEQYEDLYKHLTYDPEAPLAWTHFKIEGGQSFTGLLYVPRMPPWDMDAGTEQRRGVRLFVKRVFIMDRCEDLVPSWLRFVRGVIDSDDLPLNVSREILQDSSTARGIRKQVVRKALELLEEVARDRAEDYKTFWASFGRVLKEGLHLDFDVRDRLAGLVRYESTRDEGLVSLADYLGRMKEGQEAIYYVLGESRRAVASSPHLEALKQRGFEVLYMTDLIDPWAVEGLREFQDKKLVSATTTDLKLTETDEAKVEREAHAGTLSGLLEKVKAVLGDHVKEVRLSERLTDSPCCLVVPEGGLQAHIERLLRAHGRTVPEVKRVLELNPKHPLVAGLQSAVDRGAGEEHFKVWVETLYDQALLAEGSPIEDPARFARRVTELLQGAVAG